MKSIQNLIHSVEDASRFIEVNDEQKIAFQEARREYNKGNFHSTDELFNELLDE